MARYHLYSSTILILLAFCNACEAKKERLLQTASAAQTKPAPKKPKAEKHGEEKIMLHILTLPYSQPFANVCLNSYVPVAIGNVKARIDQIQKLEFPEPGYLPVQTPWLLAGSHANKLLALGNGHSWLVDLSIKNLLAHTLTHDHIFGAFLPEDQYVIYAGGAALLKRRAIALPAADPSAGFEDVNVSGLSGSSYLHAWIPLFGKEYLALTQSLAHPHNQNFKLASVSRNAFDKDIDEKDWRLGFPEYGARSPVLPDGTLVVHLTDSLRLVTVDGKEKLKIDEKIIFGMLSTDRHFMIWGLKETATGLNLLGFDGQGNQKVQTAINAENPTQPPVITQDNRILIATQNKVVCVGRDGKLLWEKTIPVAPELDRFIDNRSFKGGRSPLITVSKDNKILVKNGTTLHLIEQGPKDTWTLETPDKKPITSNAAITSDGRVCFACHQDVYCLAR